MVRQRREFPGEAVADPLGMGVAADPRVLDIQDQVVADVEIQVAVAVEVGPGGRGGPIAVAA
jgi:hypothetical protein